MHQIEAVLVLDGHRLRLWFDDGAVGDVDIAGRVKFRGVFKPLSTPGFFGKVRADRELGTICWPNGADLDPDVLYRVAARVEPPPPRPKPASPPSRSHEAPPERTAPGTETPVPEVSRFFGIIISMLFDDHPQPRFHVVYGDHKAKVAIDSLELITGKLPSRVLGLALEWASQHRSELRSNWNRAARGRALRRIAPLE